MRHFRSAAIGSLAKDPLPFNYHRERETRRFFAQLHQPPMLIDLKSIFNCVTWLLINVSA